MVRAYAETCSSDDQLVMVRLHKELIGCQDVLSSLRLTLHDVSFGKPFMHLGVSAGSGGRMLASVLNGERTLQVLRAALDKEQQEWKPTLLRPVVGSQEITDTERDRAAIWLVQLSQTFDFAPETYVLAISIMDRVSQLVKIRTKYLRCVAISCLYLAVKTLEDDEVIPVTLDLVRKSQCGCSISEVLRMEMVILDKLNWNVKTTTAIDFLHMMHTVMMWRFPHLLTSLKDMNPSRHLALLTRKLLICLCHADLARDRPSAVALALISLELEQIFPQWLSLLMALQNVAQVGNDELISCRERMAQLLGQRGQLITGYQLKKSSQSLKSKKRKVDETDTDDIYDGIKRLYEDNCGPSDKITITKRGSCASEMHQDADDIHAFVQAVAAV
ncbi:hypothetical protein BaRGS_00012164 [Batillaria attramentaria]|uniref:Cyclin-like domain-containing protein n=1 Tax=Batillaria attramentaria TaxID=370345 RepID=A0ABD0LC20_9CAEN